jgi:hypothetical protein
LSDDWIDGRRFDRVSRVEKDDLHAAPEMIPRVPFDVRRSVCV